MGEVTLRRRHGKHTGGTKWYQATHVLFGDSRKRESIVVYVWGPIGKITGCKILRDDQASISVYDKQVSDKQKNRNGGYYRFDGEERVVLKSTDLAVHVADTLDTFSLDGEKTKSVHAEILKCLNSGSETEENHHLHDPVVPEQVEEEKGERSTELLKAWGTFA